MRNISQIIDTLLPYLNNSLDFLPVKIELDNVEEKPPCISLMQDPETFSKMNENVIGAYDALFSFSIIYKIKDGGTASRKEATRILKSFDVFFEQATESRNLPYIGDRDFIKSIGVTVQPHYVGRDDSNNYVYSASFELRYHHKSKFEK